MKNSLLILISCMFLISCTERMREKRAAKVRQEYEQKLQATPVYNIEALEGLIEWCKQKGLNIEALKHYNQVRKIRQARLEYPAKKKETGNLGTISWHSMMGKWCIDNCLYEEARAHYSLVFKDEKQYLNELISKSDKSNSIIDSELYSKTSWKLAERLKIIGMVEEYKELLPMIVKIDPYHFEAQEAICKIKNADKIIEKKAIREKLIKKYYKPETIRAIKKGYGYLFSHQGDDGSWGKGPRVAATSMAGLALIADKVIPGIGQKGNSLKKAIEFIVSKQDKTGFITESSRMYCHALGMLFLAKAYPVTPDGWLKNDIRKVLRKAVDLSVRVQDNHGGWNYSPSKGATDISVSALQLVALINIKKAGIEVDENCINKIKKAILLAANSDGGFAYKVPNNGSSSWIRTASSVYCLLHLCKEDNPVINKALKYLQKSKKNVSGWFYYGNYFLSLAYGKAGEKYWKPWWFEMRDKIVNTQNHVEGTWKDASSGGPVFSTAIALIILQMPLQNE